MGTVVSEDQGDGVSLNFDGLRSDSRAPSAGNEDPLLLPSLRLSIRLPPRRAGHTYAVGQTISYSQKSEIPPPSGDVERGKLVRFRTHPRSHCSPLRAIIPMSCNLRFLTSSTVNTQPFIHHMPSDGVAEGQENVETMRDTGCCEV